MKSLAGHGHESLRAERLAKQLGVSRGSFYWHFPDVQAFEQAVLDQWETVAVDLPYSKANAITDQDSSAALQNLIRVVFQASVELERAVRSWATVSPLAARALGRVDQRRLSLLAALISSSETAPEPANSRAVILYWAYLGHVTTAGTMVDDGVVAMLIEQFCRT